jgi:acyl-CoA dehydrogenase
MTENTDLTSILSDLTDMVRRPEVGSLAYSAEFPRELWREFGRRGVLGLCLPEAYGGRGGGYSEAMAAGETIVREGGPLGLALSLALHWIVGRFLILGFGTEEQKSRYLPPMAAGDIIASLAASEPKTGAHPKYLSTAAVLDEDHYDLTGVKTWLTNGPVAGLFAVMAVTGEKAGRKEITAFLIPRNTIGLTTTAPIPMDSLRPSPHGGIKLDRASVPVAGVLGPIGRAYETMIKPFREIEDALLSGPAAGGLTRQVRLVAASIRQKFAMTDDQTGLLLGRLEYLAGTVRLLSREAGRILDAPTNESDLLPTLLAVRDLTTQFQTDLQTLIEHTDLEPTRELEVLTTDLTTVNRIAHNVMQLKQIRLGMGMLG